MSLLHLLGEADFEDRCSHTPPYLPPLLRAQLDASYPGGIRQYITNARKLLAESKAGFNPLEGWVPSNQYETVVQALHDATVECGLDTRPIINKLDSRLTPPTYVPVTKFTSGFQALVNTYGTPRYRECNPGAFCCIFFPFLFGIMFGDFGHGLMLAMFGYWLISKEAEWGTGAGLNDMIQMTYGGRYIILLNGLFGAYVGMLYNEAFAFPMNFFGGSRWYNSEDPSEPCEAGHDGSPVAVLGHVIRVNDRLLARIR